jgi:hypothetical protein
MPHASAASISEPRVEFGGWCCCLLLLLLLLLVQNMSPYEKRQAELEKRRELLREA